MNYELVSDEKIPETITLNLSGLEIVDKVDNVLTLLDSTKLFVLDSTIITDDIGDPVFYSSLNIGDFVSHVSNDSPGRHQYTTPLGSIPPEPLAHRGTF